ncbi:MAG: hypothetical protein WBK91_11035 [Alphaproteobacteria bacterium]
MPMIPVGYMAKRVAARPDWIKAAHVRDICAVSRCISQDFADYINFWKHNGWWFFDTPEIIKELAAKENIDCSGMRFFYYEVYAHEYVEKDKLWRGFKSESSFETSVHVPLNKELIGFDVVTFSCGSSPECSPLSCNGLAEEISVNSHCLFDTFDAAYSSLEAGKFDNSEPGPSRIFAVYIL